MAPAFEIEMGTIQGLHYGPASVGVRRKKKSFQAITNNTTPQHENRLCFQMPTVPKILPKNKKTHQDK